MGSPPTSTPTPQSVEDLIGPPDGSTAVIAGLQSRTVLNGERVTVGRLQPNGSYQVRVRGEPIALRPGNLQNVTVAGATLSATPVSQEPAREPSPDHVPPPRLFTMTELVGPPPEGVAPLD
jgi:hypothetical protein